MTGIRKSILAASLALAFMSFGHGMAQPTSGAEPRVVEIWLMGPIDMYGPAYYFVATELLGPRGTTVATSRAFRLASDESYPDIAETVARSQLVDMIIGELTVGGWQHTGMGDYWYSFQFRESR